LVATGFLPDLKKIDNNFLFFVTVTATLDNSRRSSIKILKEDHIWTLIAYEKCLLSLLKIDLFCLNSLNIVKSQCCYQTIKEQCIYNSLSDHEWWPRLPSNIAVAASQTDEMSNHNRGLSMDASYQVSVHLAKRFQRRKI
jgi:hypothetical protein